jgi:uncharacterized protein YbcC (UPF0753/DUF2309 family)
MKTSVSFNENELIEKLIHFLPAQAPLKDFITQNRLVSFQNKTFHEAMKEASEIFGYKVYLSLKDYRALYADNKIKHSILEKIIEDKKGNESSQFWLNKLFNQEELVKKNKRTGKLRSKWKSEYKVDLDSLVHTNLFKIICSYLDQGISIWHFPTADIGLLGSIKELEKNSFSSFFKTKRAKQLLLEDKCELEYLLNILVGDLNLYEHYLFDQQFAHPGWSGLAAVIQNKPETLLDTKKITLKDFIVLELLLEIDALDAHFGKIWSPLSHKLDDLNFNLFEKVETTEYDTLLAIWQEAYEFSFYDQVLGAVKLGDKSDKNEIASFQAFFCIDDRECSIRRHVEKIDTNCKTYGTPGHFNVEFYFQPEHGKFHTKVCPAPVTPKFLVKEIENNTKRKNEIHFTKQANSLLFGWLFTHTVGLWSGFKLMLNIFSPRNSSLMVSSFQHMAKNSKLSIENRDPNDKEGDLQIGFSIDEMTDRVEGLLKSTGLVDNFSPIVYAVGHGSSSVNNTHYAVYDCGACSGRPGSVNARALSYMGNHKVVREKLASRGIHIPNETQFIGALHDTSRDEILFYDVEILSEKNKITHKQNEINFNLALDNNAKERARRFLLVDTHDTAKKIHDKVKKRSITWYEPRPELTHCGNALCIVGSRILSKGLFLDRRSFLNSYNYKIDPEGNYLLSILNAVAPVCGGINLEYYFSRVDNHILGAGTKLPHNVMGLFGVANGIEGDLRTGLPNQMVEIHEPLRLMAIVEHYPEVILQAIKKNPSTYEWFANEWVRLVAIHPETGEFYLMRNGEFESYTPLTNSVETVENIMTLVESSHDALSVQLIKNN